MGISLESDKNEKNELFFTNFIPWYRADGEKSSGGSLQEWIEPSVPLFSRLVDIINPRVILCLGKTVFDGIRMAAGQEYNYKGKKYYNDVIGTGAEVVDFKGKSIYVVPLAHSGNYGNLNRNERKKTDPSTRYAKQIQDWKAWYKFIV